MLLRKLLLPSQSEVEPQEPVKVTINNPQGAISTLTFGADLNVSNAECVSDNAGGTEFRATFLDDSTTRTFIVSSLTPYGNKVTTTDNGVEVYHLYDNETKTRDYAWKIGETNSFTAYIHMIVDSSLSITVDHIKDLATYITAEFNNSWYPAVERVVTVDTEDTFISKVIFGADLFIDRTVCVYADSTMVQIDAHFYGEEYDRSFGFSQMSMGSASESLGTTQDGISVNYSNNSGIYTYEWEIMNENSPMGTYIAMTCSKELTIEDIGFIISNMTIESKSNF